GDERPRGARGWSLRRILKEQSCALMAQGSQHINFGPISPAAPVDFSDLASHGEERQAATERDLVLDREEPGAEERVQGALPAVLDPRPPREFVVGLDPRRV